ncbi:MAG: PIN domain-containing protein [Leptolyngbya sp.]|nr:MAG: PIN domain-containing protein [Leptolyngbya sp.]
MYIFDTDHLSLIQRNGQEGKRILARIETIDDLEIAVTVITYEEQAKGRLSILAKAKTLDEQVFAYQGLQQLAIDYHGIAILPFSHAAALEHQRLRKAYPRLGNMDLKIAAIALINHAILLTRNVSDFGQVSELRTEDWSGT